MFAIVVSSMLVLVVLTSAVVAFSELWVVAIVSAGLLSVACSVCTTVCLASVVIGGLAASVVGGGFVLVVSLGPSASGISSSVSLPSSSFSVVIVLGSSGIVVPFAVVVCTVSFVGASVVSSSFFSVVRVVSGVVTVVVCLVLATVVGLVVGARVNAAEVVTAGGGGLVGLSGERSNP